MPRFYFDTDDGERHFYDEVGIDLADRDAIPEEVMGLLRDLAHVHLPVGRRVMTVQVRTTSGAAIYRGTVTIVGEVIGKL